MACSSSSDESINERTRLLDKPSQDELQNHKLVNKILEYNKNTTNIKANIPQNTICYNEAINSMDGKGLETQINSRSSEHQLYGSIKEGPRKPSNASIKIVHTSQNDQSTYKSPYLAGVSVRRFWVIFGVILASYFIACFDTTIMISSHPVITSYFKSSNSASWLSTAFLLTSTGFQPVYGRLSDTIGRKKPYIFSLAVFLIATIWCGLARSMTSFIIARAVCGLGAGGMITLSSILTSDLVPIEIRGIYQSYINIFYGIGSASGAALGGWIADSLGWRWEFGIQVPTLLVCLCVALITLPSNIGLAEGVEEMSLLEALKIFDYQGSILLTISITFLILGLNLGGNIYSWTHPVVLASFIVFILFFPLFIYVQSYTENPIMPLKIILQNPRAGLILTNSLGTLTANAVIFNIPLFYQAVMLDSATNSGFRLIVPSIVSSIAATSAGFLITWSKQLKIYLVFGVLSLFIGSVGVSFLQRGWPNWVYILFLVPNSIGQGLINPTTFMAVLAVSLQSEQAVVTSTLILWRSLATVFGVSFSSLILQNTLVFFLNRYVVGPDRSEVIEAVRKSVEAIKDLDPWYQAQVRDSYTAALRASFAGAAILSVICAVITFSLKLPRLGQKPKTLCGDHAG